MFSRSSRSTGAISPSTATSAGIVGIETNGVLDFLGEPRKAVSAAGKATAPLTGQLE